MLAWPGSAHEGATSGSLAGCAHMSGGAPGQGRVEEGAVDWPRSGTGRAAGGGLAGCALRERRRPGRIRAQGGSGLAEFEQEGGHPGRTSRTEGGDLEILHREMRSQAH
jgi:hypothetical protein